MNIEKLIAIVKETDKIFFDDVLRGDISKKGDSDYVTRADIETSKYMEKRLKEEFPELYNNKELCDQLFKSYKKVFLRIIEEETYLLSPEERGMLQSNRSLQLNEIKTLLAIQDEEKSNEEIEYLIREYCRKAFGVEDPDFKYVWEICLDEMSAKDKPFFELLLPQIEDEVMQRQLKKKLNRLA